jgi:hypothetical protein
VHIPFKKLETSKLFNEVEVHSSVEADFGTSATLERDTPESYSLELKLKVRVPKAKFELAQLTSINPVLPQVLPALDSLVKDAKVSHFFGDFYGLKVASLQRNLSRLDLLLSRHNFFDCETILELQHPETKRRALLIQSDMDIDMDGSDSDRVPSVEGSTANFQPMTSYKWPKKTEAPNGFLPTRESKLQLWEAELAAASKTGTNRPSGTERIREMREALPALRYEVSQLKNMSFLVAATDPYVVLPGSIVGKNREAFTPHLGDYCVVIYGDKLYPAIIGDVGPSNKMGEASLRLGKEINPRSTAYNRSSNDLKVTYLVFPGSADKPWGPPDLDKWHERCDALLKELGGYSGQLHAWENLIPPPPTPTPAPSPSPSTSPSPAVPANSGTSPAPTNSLKITGSVPGL